MESGPPTDVDLSLLCEVPAAHTLAAHQAAAKRIIKRLKSVEDLDALCRVGILTLIPSALQKSAQTKVVEYRCGHLFDLTMALSRVIFEGPKPHRAKGAMPPIHYGVTCDQCGVTPLKGKRWKSLNQYDFDLCNTCFGSLPSEEKEGFKEIEPRSRSKEYEIGDTVQARSRTGRYFEGVIAHEYGDGVCLVEWANGDLPTRVDSSSMRPAGSHASVLGRRSRHAVPPPPEVLSSILVRSALAENDANLTRMLLADGADLNFKDDRDLTPLMMAITNSLSEEIVAILLDGRADPNMTAGEPSRTPLQAAAAMGGVSLVQLLLDHSAEPIAVEGCSAAVQTLIQTHIDAKPAEPEAMETVEISAERLDELRVQLSNCLLPTLLGILPNLPPTAARRTLVAVSLLLENGPATLLHNTSETNKTTLLKLIESLLSTESLATAMMVRYGVAAMAKQMSESKFIKKRAMSSESGNTSVADVTTLASAVAAQLQKLNKGSTGGKGKKKTPLQSVCSRLGTGASNRAAVHELQKLLAIEGAVTAFELTQHRFSESFIKLAQCHQQPDQFRCTLREAFLDQPQRRGGEPRAGLQHLIELLEHDLASHNQLPVYSHLVRGAPGVRAVTTPVNLTIQSAEAIAASGAAPEHAVVPAPAPAPAESMLADIESLDQELQESDDELPMDPESATLRDAALLELLGAEHGGGINNATSARQDPFAAAVARAVSGNARSRAIAKSAAQESEKVGQITVRAEPLLRMHQLECHVLRTCKITNSKYLKYCQQLVGAVISDRSRQAHTEAATVKEYRKALVLKFRCASPAEVAVHLVRYDSGEECELVLAVRDYVIEHRQPEGADGTNLSFLPADSKPSDPVNPPEARIHKVLITCPEGFPVDMFLESVKPSVKRALSQPEPGQVIPREPAASSKCVYQAPMNRPPGSQYQWPDRGWHREAEFCSMLETALNATGTGPVARGQTLIEAQLLVKRLSSVVVATVAVDHSFVMAQHSMSDPTHPTAQTSMCKGMRVHGVLQASSSDWLPATVVHAKPDCCTLVYDDGLFMEGVPPAQVRVPKAAGGLHEHLHDDPSGLHDFLRRHLGMATVPGALTSTAGQLRCQYAAFETGSVNRAGHIDLDNIQDPAANQKQQQDMSHCEQPPSLRVQFKSPNNPKQSTTDSASANVSLFRALQLLQPGSSAVASRQRSSDTNTLQYAVVFDPQPDATLSDQSENDRQDVTKLPAQLADRELGLSKQLQQTLLVLYLLHSVFEDIEQLRWVSSALSHKLILQLQDPLCIAAAAVPVWFQKLPRLCPFLFTLCTRRMQLESSSFGVSHSVNWVQMQAAQARRVRLAERRVAAERAAAVAAQNDDMEQIADAAERLAELEDEAERDRIGHLKSDIVKISRENILAAAEKLMGVHGDSKAALEVQFREEDGFGSGVTQNFYCAVAVALQVRGTNIEVPMWVPDGPGDLGYLNCVCGLYPMPLKQAGGQFKVVCSRYRFLGCLMAKALRDGFIVPMPISKHFIAMVCAHQPSTHWLPDTAATGGVVTAYARAVAEHAEDPTVAIGSCEFTRRYLGQDVEMTLDEYLEAASARWEDPISGVAIVSGGQQRELIATEVAEYVNRMLQWWFVESVAGQVAAFVEGFSQVLAVNKLVPFTPSELLTMLCGDNSVEWDLASLNQNLKPTASLTTNSPLFQLLVQYLLRLENDERAAFLNFVTACPRLPPGGIRALNIEVGPSNSEGRIPTSQTCVPKLYLPNYQTIDDLHKGFVTAFENAEAGGFHERSV